MLIYLNVILIIIPCLSYSDVPKGENFNIGLFHIF